MMKSRVADCFNSLHIDLLFFIKIFKFILEKRGVYFIISKIE